MYATQIYFFCGFVISKFISCLTLYFKEHHHHLQENLIFISFSKWIYQRLVLVFFFFFIRFDVPNPFVKPYSCVLFLSFGLSRNL